MEKEKIGKKNPVLIRIIELVFLNGRIENSARATGNNAAWICECGNLLIGRCYPDSMVTDCQVCNKRYKVCANHDENEKQTAERVVEEPA